MRMWLCKNLKLSQTKEELIIPDCTGSFSEGGLQFDLTAAGGHNRVPFF